MITEQHLQNYLNHIAHQYTKWHKLMGFNNESNSIEKFKNSLRYQEGKTFIKIIREGSVHSFIVKEGNKQFQEGDVLKAASWKAPAKNFARGNILNNDLNNIDWSM